MTTKVLKSSSVQRVITFRLIKIIHVSTCVSNKYIHVYTKLRIKTNKQIKKKGEKKEMLQDSNPHLLSAKDSLLSIRLSRNYDFFVHKSNCATI